MIRLSGLVAGFLIAAATAANADVFRILDDPQEAAQARVDLIQQATSEIDALYFLARNDRITLTALSLLRDARRRGVGNVRLIVDANFQHIPNAVLAHLLDEGVQIRVYHPITLRHLNWIFRRMHEKVVVVDGNRYITGGRNLAESYFGLAKSNYVDRDVYVEGESAAEADRHFESLWNSGHVADLKVRVTDDEKSRAALRLDEASEQLQRGKFLELHTQRDWSEGLKEIGSVRFLHDPIAPKTGPSVTDCLREILSGATRSIVIESPYLIPSKGLLELLEKKAAEGVSIRVLTNSLRSTDGVLPYAAFIKYRRRLVRAGIEVREYKGPDSLHAKSLVIDERIALVGSYNVDPRSENLNTEVMCVAEDEEVARALLDSIEQHAANAWKFDRSRPVHQRVSRAAKIRTWMARRLLVPWIESQL